MLMAVPEERPGVDADNTDHHQGQYWIHVEPKQYRPSPGTVLDPCRT